jgi:cell fate regulator YaaT (PSP1 superfamily)
MSEVVGVRFKRAGKIYYFDPAGIDMGIGDWVVLDTGRGPELGHVVIAPKQVPDNEITEPLKPVMRKAGEEDLNKRSESVPKEQKILDRCRDISANLGLPMKFISANYNLDYSRVTICFSAEGRVDFRDLLKELASTFKSRIELRQVGPRDEAKIVGGYGRCGLPLCCTTHLSEFTPFSIRMAKEQDLPLNPVKISGICGRLLCCLGYESEQYHFLKENLPPAGQQVSTAMGPGTVIGGNPLKQTVLVKLDSEATAELPVGDIKREGKRPPKKRGG